MTDLINLVRQHEVLYNTCLRAYKDFPVRNEAWEKIALKLNVPVDQCREDWTKLRNAYSNAMKRRRTRRSSGESMTAWKYEEQMSFLLPYMELRPNPNLNSIVPQQPLPEDHLIESIEIPNLSPEFYHIEAPQIMQNLTPHGIKVEHIEPQDDEKSSNEVSLQKTLTNSYMDETDLFLYSMGKAIKLLPKLEQIQIKFDLHKAVYHAQMRQIEPEEKEHEEKKRRIWKEN